MEYITTAERFGMEKGMEKGKIEGEMTTWQKLLQDSLLNPELVELAKHNIANLTRKLEVINRNPN